MTKKSLVVSTLLAVAMTPMSAGAAFSDIPTGHWAEAAVTWAEAQGLMKGPADKPGTFDPAGVANRAQMATVFMRFADLMEDKLADVYTKIDELTKAGNTTENFGMNMLEAGLLNKTFSASLNGRQEVPVVNTNGTGTGHFMLSSEGLHYHVEVSGLAGSITGAHLHTGAIGVSGPARHSMQFRNGVAMGTWRLADMTREDLAMLLHGEIYVNVHTNNFGDGEIRGQLMGRKADVFHGMLSNEQETADVDSNGEGMVHAALYGNNLVYLVSYKNLSTNFTGAHFHAAAPGDNGGVVKEVSCDTTDMMCAGAWMNLTDADKQALWMGNLYVNIHTGKYPNGELRAQLNMQ